MGASVLLLGGTLWAVGLGAHPPDPQGRHEPRHESHVEDARRTFEQAEAEFQAGRFEQAARLFRRAFETYPRTALLYNEAFAWEKAGRPARAAEALTAYLDQGGGESTAEVRRWREKLERRLRRTHGRVEVVVTPAARMRLVAEAGDHGVDWRQTPWKGWVPPGAYRLEVEAAGHVPTSRPVAVLRRRRYEHTLTLQRAVGRLSVDANVPGAVVRLDGRTVGATPVVGAEVPSGQRAVWVSGAGFLPWAALIEVPLQGEVEVEAALVPLVPMEGATWPRRAPHVFLASEPAPRTLRLWGWTTFGLGVATAAAGAVFNVGVGLPRAESAGELDSRSPTYDADFDAIIGEAQALNVAGYAMYGIGGALVVTGVVLLIVDAATVEEVGPIITAAPRPGGALLVVGGGF